MSRLLVEANGNIISVVPFDEIVRSPWGAKLRTRRNDTGSYPRTNPPWVGDLMRMTKGGTTYKYTVVRVVMTDTDWVFFGVPEP